MVYRLVRILVNILTSLTLRVTAHGVEKLPLTGSYIVAGNHLGRLDVALLYRLLRRDDIIIIVAEKYKKSAIFRWLVRGVDAIYVDRFNADFSVMRQVLERLKKGQVFVVAPEGTRSRSEALLEGRSGAAYLAAKAGVPVYPVALAGSEDRVVKKLLKRLRRAPVTCWVGDPITFAPLPRLERDAALQQYTDEIMCQIAALLPPAYRGVYQDHPRLRQLLAQEEGAPSEGG